MIQRRHFLSAIAVLTTLLYSASPMAWGDALSGHLPQIHNLAEVGKSAAEHPAGKLPIMLYFSAPGCPYCLRMEEMFLNPMYASGRYQQQIVMVMISLGDQRQFIAFNGENTTINALRQQYQIRVTPTIVIVDSHGETLTEPTIGVINPDYFVTELEEKFTAALTKVRQP
ncbi:MAG: thioredoxin fold domain-containing protein [Gammaproteobacteria bacterium]|nr:thioredoxin fold domain-containing protein [Gammaproteobacteria bacterium]